MLLLRESVMILMLKPLSRSTVVWKLLLTGLNRYRCWANGYWGRVDHTASTFRVDDLYLYLILEQSSAATKRETSDNRRRADAMLKNFVSYVRRTALLVEMIRNSLHLYFRRSISFHFLCRYSSPSGRAPLSVKQPWESQVLWDSSSGQIL
jgi:hypothetical protein